MGLELENEMAEYLVGSGAGCLEGFEVGEGDCRLVGSGDRGLEGFLVDS